MKWHNKNLGRHPQDPDYDDGHDPKEDYERWLEEQEDKEQRRKEE